MTFEEKREIEEKIGVSLPFVDFKKFENKTPLEYENFLITIRDNFDKIWESGDVDDDL